MESMVSTFWFFPAVLWTMVSASLWFLPSMVSTQGSLQLVHLLCEEGYCFKAGFALGGAARKGGVVAQTVVIHQIAEGETVAEQNGLARRAVHGRLVRAIQRGKLFDIGGGVGGVGILVIGIKLLQGVGRSRRPAFWRSSKTARHARQLPPHGHGRGPPCARRDPHRSYQPGRRSATTFPDQRWRQSSRCSF